jgi:serine/threonine protein kinase
VRRCLSCGGRFEEPRRVCPEDGDVLIAEGRTTTDSGRVLDDRYRLGLLIGEGGMGHVFEATDLASGATVAVKLLKSIVVDESSEKRFRLEAMVLEALTHPGIVKVLDFRQTKGGATYMVMERLVGPTFSQLRRAGKFASPERVVDLMREASEIISSAHDSGIVHRDIKPSNLVLHRIDKERSQVKVLDFGIAKVLERASEGLTLTGEMIGTLLYMAPEQSSGGHVTPATDVYSLGAVLFEAIAGRHPFDARSSAELIWLQASAPPPALSSFRPEITSELDDLVGRCLAKKPENRYANAGELARALASVRTVRGDEDYTSTRTLHVNPSLWVGTILDDRYELHEWIAPGRFRSHVYRATHLRTGANVAVRVWRTGTGAVRDLLIEAFRNEARAMGVRHPNLIAIVDLGFTDKCVYIVTEFVESVSLRDLLLKRKCLALAAAAQLVRGAADALGALHLKEIVSGGLSPETMRVTGTIEAPEQLLLTPLGLTNLKQIDALASADGGADGDRLRDYMSPEQRAGEKPDARSDVYSLGLVFVEMLGGEIHDRTWTTDSGSGKAAVRSGGSKRGAAMVAKSAKPATARPGEVRVPPGLPAPWSAFLARCIASDPASRFQNGSELLASLPKA